MTLEDFTQVKSDFGDFAVETYGEEYVSGVGKEKDDKLQPVLRHYLTVGSLADLPEGMTVPKTYKGYSVVVVLNTSRASLA